MNAGEDTHRHVFFVSDSTGITVETLGSARLSQFDHVQFITTTIPFGSETLAGFAARYPAGTRFVVAFSGGADSLALLHAFTTARAHGHTPNLHAIHVDHHLHPDSTRWARHCAEICRRLSVELTVLDAHVEEGEVVRADEGVARAIRYRAFERTLASGDVLCTAHTEDDHVETVLLNLLRGAGPRGLAGIPPERRLGEGIVARPVRGVARAALRAYARETGLPTIRDPANEDERFARVLLRRSVIPVLEARWPGMRGRIARAAELGRESAELLDALATIDLGPAGGVGGDTLDAVAVAALDPARRRNAIAGWLRARGIASPGARRIEQIARAVIGAKADAMPCVSLGDMEVRRFRGRLRLVPRERPLSVPAPRRWRIPEPLAFDHGELGCERCTGEGLDDGLREMETVVRFRGEDAARMRPMQVRGHALKKRFQSLAIPPWERGRIPLVYVGGILAAVGSAWIDRRFAAAPGTPGWRVVWTPRPRPPRGRAG